MFDVVNRFALARFLSSKLVASYGHGLTSWVLIGCFYKMSSLFSNSCDADWIKYSGGAVSLVGYSWSIIRCESILGPSQFRTWIGLSWKWTHTNMERCWYLLKYGDKDILPRLSVYGCMDWMNPVRRFFSCYPITSIYLIGIRFIGLGVCWTGFDQIQSIQLNICHHKSFKQVQRAAP